MGRVLRFFEGYSQKKWPVWESALKVTFLPGQFIVSIHFEKSGDHAYCYNIVHVSDLSFLLEVSQTLASIANTCTNYLSPVVFYHLSQ